MENVLGDPEYFNDIFILIHIKLNLMLYNIMVFFKFLEHFYRLLLKGAYVLL